MRSEVRRETVLETLSALPTAVASLALSLLTIYAPVPIYRHPSALTVVRIIIKFFLADDTTTTMLPPQYDVTTAMLPYYDASLPPYVCTVQLLSVMCQHMSYFFGYSTVRDL